MKRVTLSCILLTGRLDTKPPDFVRWSSAIRQPQVFTVLPDGCRDIVLRAPAGRPAQVRLTDWDLQPRQIMLTPGDCTVGFRLRPGLSLRKSDLTEVIHETDVQALICDAAAKHADTCAAIDALGGGDTPVCKVASQLGVSLRTLQRKFARLGLPSPEFWRLLGRARRVAVALSSDMPLIDVAGIYGYSDQAHMTRACRRWFNQTPQNIRRSPTLQTDFDQPALGAWTDEQTSIK